MIRTTTFTVALLVSSTVVHGAVTVFTDKEAWQSAAPTFATITFAELPANTWITDQYAALGVHFTDNSDLIYHSTSLFVDNFGLNGAFDETTLEFDVPMTTIAMDFPGHVRIHLYSNGSLVYTSPILGSSGIGHFAGLISNESFDKVLIDDPLLGLVVDNPYFGPSVPAPGALVAFACAALIRIRRRRRA